ncbi:Holliday junction resolvase RuvX [Mycoplasmoides pneumoniae]|uniref:Holliday junction resolvase RuvX n=1 Tax=Mycoplasmoides pneumoniae TaxID=2104 RepID=UPI0013309385|nr:Holliday junction resolvase RuvX [Mycoplasmoides pneumoniae]
MQYILGIDFGLKRIGTALINTIDRFPSPFRVFAVQNNLQQAVNTLFKDLKQAGYELVQIVIGFPHFHYQSSIQVSIHKFVELIKTRFNVPVTLIDESGTTSEVKANLQELGLKNRTFKKAKDTLAATLILERFLNQQKPN